MGTELKTKGKEQYERSIYVYTPNREEVVILNMTGAIVKNEEQVGLMQYDSLERGIYIVRVGEQVFKIRL